MPNDFITIHCNTACTFLIQTYHCLFMFTNRAYAWLLLVLDTVTARITNYFPILLPLLF